MVSSLDIKGWSNEIQIWKKESWFSFLEEAKKLYVLLNEFYSFYSWLRKEFNGKRIEDLPNDLKGLARLIVAGGGDSEQAFARLMFELFGVRVKGTESYGESLNIYLWRGDNASIEIEPKILGVDIKKFNNELQKLEKMIQHFSTEIKVTSELSFDEWVKDTEPQLISKLNEFVEISLGLLEPHNPYVLFTRYFQVTTLLAVEQFLTCSFEDIHNLANILGVNQVYNKKLELQPLNDVNTGNLHNFAWILTPETTGGIILELFGEFGFVHEIIRKIYPEVDESFKELWRTRYESIVALTEGGKWPVLEETKEFVTRFANKYLDPRYITSSRHEIIYNARFTGMFSIDSSFDKSHVLGECLVEYSRAPYRIESGTRYTKIELRKITPITFLLDIFPFLACNYIRCNKAKKNSIEFEIRLSSKYNIKEDSFESLGKKLIQRWLSNGEK